MALLLLTSLVFGYFAGHGPLLMKLVLNNADEFKYIRISRSGKENAIMQTAPKSILKSTISFDVSSQFLYNKRTNKTEASSNGRKTVLPAPDDKVAT